MYAAHKLNQGASQVENLKHYKVDIKIGFVLAILISLLTALASITSGVSMTMTLILTFISFFVVLIGYRALASSLEHRAFKAQLDRALAAHND